MAAYGKPSGRDLTEHVLQRLEAVEAQVKKTRGAGLRSAMDRGDTAAMPSPVEGQTMIQYDGTKTPRYYADGAWHEFGGTVDAVAQSPIIIPINWCGSSTFGKHAVDNTLPSNRYLSNAKDNNGTVRTPAVSDKFTTNYFALGPKGSQWLPVIEYLTDPSGGQLTVELASIPNDTSPGGTGSVVYPGSLDRTSADWIEIDNSNLVDTYSASAAYGNKQLTPFRMIGDPGAAFATFGDSADPQGFANTIDGGSGIYSIRLTVASKNASSTGFLAQIAAVYLFRADDNGWEITANP